MIIVINPNDEDFEEEEPTGRIIMIKRQ